MTSAGSPSTGRGTTPGGGASGAPTTSGTSGGSTENPYRDDAGVGDMARRYLQVSPATRVAVEIDFVRGRRPSSDAMAHVRAILARETGKPVTVTADDEIPAGDGTTTFAQIAALERAHRDTHSSGGTATMWIAYLDGELQDEAATLGVANTASTAIIFADRIDEARSPVLGADEIERSVLTHEVGHLLALVNIGYTSRHDHEDPQSRGHSKSNSSVMYHAIEDVGLIGLLSGGPPDDLDADDRDDLAALRRGE